MPARRACWRTPLGAPFREDPKAASISAALPLTIAGALHGHLKPATCPHGYSSRARASSALSAPNRCSGCRARLDFSERGAGGGDPQVIIRLKVSPKLRRHPKVLPQPQGNLGADRPLLVHHLVDSGEMQSL